MFAPIQVKADIVKTQKGHTFVLASAASLVMEYSFGLKFGNETGTNCTGRTMLGLKAFRIGKLLKAYPFAT